LKQTHHKGLGSRNSP